MADDLTEEEEGGLNKQGSSQGDPHAPSPRELLRLLVLFLCREPQTLSTARERSEGGARRIK